MANFDSSGTYISGFSYATRTTITFTTPSNESYSLVSVGTNPAQTGQYDINFMQIEVGSTASPYMPYGTHNWYIEKNIGKVVDNGTANWARGSFGTNPYYLQVSNMKIPTDSTPNYVFCNLFKGVAYKDRTISGDNIVYADMSFGLYIRNTTYATLSDFTTFLASNPITIYYVLANPTYEIITNDNLIEQLENAQDMYLVDNLCYVNWEGIIPAIFTLQYPTTDTLNAYITTEDNKLIRTEWGS